MSKEKKPQGQRARSLRALAKSALEGKKLTISLTLTLREVEARYAVEVLKAHGWNKTTAAEALGISRRTLLARLAELDAATTAAA